MRFAMLPRLQRLPLQAARRLMRIGDAEMMKGNAARAIETVTEAAVEIETVTEAVVEIETGEEIVEGKEREKEVGIGGEIAAGVAIVGVVGMHQATMDLPVVETDHGILGAVTENVLVIGHQVRAAPGVGIRVSPLCYSKWRVSCSSIINVKKTHAMSNRVNYI